ncbi:MAG: hypothetical protein JXM73_19820 [Anaerolineae bacterium]|nr:hypothetical protein [Anaerolineae bacterium]
MGETWYHGAPLELTVLRPGSTITRDRHLAEIFSHKPAIVSMDDDGAIRHDGTQPGLLYRIAEPVGADDVYPHPRSSMAPGLEWLTRRELRIELIGLVAIRETERLTLVEMAMIQERLARRDRGAARPPEED